MVEEKVQAAPEKRIAEQFLRTICFVVPVLFSSCAANSPESIYGSVWRLYTSGALRAAADAASSESQKLKHDSRWYWEFRLLSAEALLAQAKVPEASALLKDPVPLALAANQLEIRRLMDQADALSKSEHMSNALAALDSIRSAAADPNLRIRIEVLRGAVLGHLGRLDQAENTLKWAVAEAIR